MSNVFSAITSILLLVCSWRIMQKMDEPGWKGIVPIYNSYVFFQKVWNVGAFIKYLIFSFCAGLFYGLATAIGGSQDISRISSPVAIVFLVLAAIAGIGLLIFSIKFANRLCKSFGYGTGMTLIYLFLPYIAMPILAFGKAEFSPLYD